MSRKVHRAKEALLSSNPVSGNVKNEEDLTAQEANVEIGMDYDNGRVCDSDDDEELYMDLPEYTPRSTSTKSALKQKDQEEEDDEGEGRDDDEEARIEDSIHVADKINLSSQFVGSCGPEPYLTDPHNLRRESYDPQYEYDAPRYRDFGNHKSDGLADRWFDLQQTDEIELTIPIEFPNLCVEFDAISPVTNKMKSQKGKIMKSSDTAEINFKSSSRLHHSQNTPSGDLSSANMKTSTEAGAVTGRVSESRLPLRPSQRQPPQSQSRVKSNQKSSRSDSNEEHSDLNVASPDTQQVSQIATPSARNDETSAAPECLLSALKTASNRRETVLARRTLVPSASKGTPAIARLLFTSPAFEVSTATKSNKKLETIVSPESEGSPALATIARFIRFDEDDNANESPVAPQLRARILECVDEEDDSRLESSSSPTSSGTDSEAAATANTNKRAFGRSNATSSNVSSSTRVFRPNSMKQSTSLSSESTVLAKKKETAALTSSRRVVKVREGDNKRYLKAKEVKAVRNQLPVEDIDTASKSTALVTTIDSQNKSIARRVIKVASTSNSKLQNMTNDSVKQNASSAKISKPSSSQEKNVKLNLTIPRVAFIPSKKPSNETASTNEQRKKVMSIRPASARASNMKTTQVDMKINPRPASARSAVSGQSSKAEVFAIKSQRISKLQSTQADQQQSTNQDDERKTEPKVLPDNVYQRLMMRSSRRLDSSASEPSSKSQILAKQTVHQQKQFHKQKENTTFVKNRSLKTSESIPQEKSESSTTIENEETVLPEKAAELDIMSLEPEEVCENEPSNQLMSVEANRKRRMSRRAWHDLETEVEETEDATAALEKQLLEEMLKSENEEQEDAESSKSTNMDTDDRFDPQDQNQAQDQVEEDKNDVKVYDLVNDDKSVDKGCSREEGEKVEVRNKASKAAGPSSATSVSHISNSSQKVKPNRILTTLEMQLEEIARRREELKKVLNRNRRALSTLGMHEPPATSLEDLAAARPSRSVSRDRRNSVSKEINTSFTLNSIRRSSSTSRSRNSISILQSDVSTPAAIRSSSQPRSVTVVVPPVLHTALRAEVWAMRHKDDETSSQTSEPQQFKALPLDPKVLSGVEKHKADVALAEKHNAFKPTDPRTPPLKIALRTRRASNCSESNVEDKSKNNEGQSLKAQHFKSRTDEALAQAAKLTRSKQLPATAAIGSIERFSTKQIEENPSVMNDELDSETKELIEGIDELKIASALPESQVESNKIVINNADKDSTPIIENTNEVTQSKLSSKATSRKALNHIDENVVNARTIQEAKLSKTLSKSNSLNSNTFKARPAPRFAPFIIKKSSRPPTVPVTPRLLTRSASLGQL